MDLWFKLVLERLRNKKKGRIDVRSLEDVGIVGGMVLTADFVQKVAVDLRFATATEPHR